MGGTKSVSVVSCTIDTTQLPNLFPFSTQDVTQMFVVKYGNDCINIQGYYGIGKGKILKIPLNYTLYCKNYEFINSFVE